jgi:hypothetical protein
LPSVFFVLGEERNRGEGAMRKHGWQLPYHPLQVVAIAVFAALGFAFYVFFLPFVGGNTAQYVALALYTPLVSAPSTPSSTG